MYEFDYLYILQSQLPIQNIMYNRKAKTIILV